jgi:hypothetical protein
MPLILAAWSVQPIIDKTIKICHELDIVHRKGGVDQITSLAFEGQLPDGVVAIVAPPMVFSKMDWMSRRAGRPFQ